MVNFKTDTEIRNFYTAADNQYPFQLNALIMLSLIENAEYITYNLEDGVYDPYSLHAYKLDDGKTVLQAGTDGFYSGLSRELYTRLAESFE